MEIKEAILDIEKERVKTFLGFFNLKYSSNLDITYYIEEDDKIIGTISAESYIIKDLAVDKEYQSENISSILINQIINYFRMKNIYSYHVYTKPIYKNTFLSLGFRLLIETDNVIFLESGVETINNKIEKIKNMIETAYMEISDETDIASVVVNANPITNGHMYLIEEASKNHELVLCFVVEEDKSMFTFEERFSLVYLACKRLSNVIVIPSTKYIVSSSTFPSYFLKSEEMVDMEYAKVDALIFKNYFMKNLYIKKRYLGSETKEKMVVYNNTLKDILGSSCIVLDRLKDDDCVVSASKVRKLIKNGLIDEALKYVPNEIKLLIKGKANNG